MGSVEGLVATYGLAIVVAVMLAKSAGVPIPVPADVLMLATAARAASGQPPLLLAFSALLLAMALGSSLQFALARGPGRAAIYRFGRHVGLTRGRLDAAAATVERGGPIAVALAIAAPGVRAVAVAACGIARLPLRTFVPGLLLGDTVFLGFHLSLGYLGLPFLARLAGSVPTPLLVGVAVLVLAAALAGWMALRRREHRGATPGELAAEALAAWDEAACPICLGLAAVRRRSALAGSVSPNER